MMGSEQAAAALPDGSVDRDRFDELARRLGERGQRAVSLAPLCTYKVGGRAEVLVEANAVADLQLVNQALTESFPDPDRRCPVLVVGRGSNLLVSDRGFPGLVIILADGFDGIEIDAEAARVVAGGMALLPVVARRSAAAALTGFEWAVGVPGSIGGAVRMNAGGHGSDMAESLVRVSLFDLWSGGPTDCPAADLDLGYRHSAIGPGQIVLSAELGLSAGDRAESEARISEIVAWRRAHQPGGQNAGSVFANPPGDSAGRLIDSLGLKGFRIGTAEVSPKHANFIQADPGGSADDVHAVLVAVQRRVAESTGVELRPENLLIGFDEPIAPDETPTGGRP